MTAITYTAARANLAKTMDRVVDDHDPIIITRNSEQSVVLLSLMTIRHLKKPHFSSELQQMQLGFWLPSSSSIQEKDSSKNSTYEARVL